MENLNLNIGEEAEDELEEIKREPELKQVICNTCNSKKIQLLGVRKSDLMLLCEHCGSILLLPFEENKPTAIKPLDARSYVG